MLEYPYIAAAGSSIDRVTEVGGITYEGGTHAKTTTYADARWTAKSVSIRATESGYEVSATLRVETAGGDYLAELVEMHPFAELTIPQDSVAAMTQADGAVIVPLAAVQALLEAAIVPLVQAE